MLACIVDYCGYRVNLVCIPPVDEEKTLVHGRVDVKEEYQERDPMLQVCAANGSLRIGDWASLSL